MPSCSSCSSCSNCGTVSYPSTTVVAPNCSNCGSRPAPVLAPAVTPAPAHVPASESISPYNAIEPKVTDPKPVTRIPAQAGEPPLADIARVEEESIITIRNKEIPVVDAKTASRTIATIEFQAPESPTLSPELSNRVSYAEDYSWVKGQLRKIGEQWLVVYTGDEKDDLFGGRFVLAPQVNMSNCRTGDLVHVRGQVIAGRENSDAPATYRAVAIEVMQR